MLSTASNVLCYSDVPEATSLNDEELEDSSSTFFMARTIKVT